MQTLLQDKKRCIGFLNELAKSCEVIAPVKTDLVRFQAVKDASLISLEKNSYFPVKEYFFKKKEVLMKFDGMKITVPQFDTPERAFFGLRKCDLNGILHQDKVFIDGAHDPYYTAARHNSVLIGYHCDEAPSPYCFCGSMGLVDFFDLMYYDKGDHYLVEVGSDRGAKLAKKFAKFFVKSSRELAPEERIIKNADRLKVSDISGLYENPGWKKAVDLCLSCSACTSLCPTCYCFEIHDEISSKDQQKADRIREWSSCQQLGFTKVAGSTVFRKEREQRFKHRIYHQLDYFKKKNGINLCVGCGRCIEGCPTRIDFVKTINEMTYAKN